MKKFFEIIGYTAALILLLVVMGVITGCAPKPEPEDDLLDRIRDRCLADNIHFFQHLETPEGNWRQECAPIPGAPKAPKENA